MSQVIPASNDRSADRVQTLRLQVQFAVLLGGMNDVLQECLQELRLLTQVPVPVPSLRKFK